MKDAPQAQQAAPSSFVSLHSLPSDISSQILSHLSLRDIIAYSLVSSSCREASINNDFLWKLKFEQRWYLKKSPHDDYNQQECLTGGVASLPRPCHMIQNYPIQHRPTDHKSHDYKNDLCNSGIHRISKKRLQNRSIPFIDSDRFFWKRCYQAAYSNPHDLWITHWNCVAPMEQMSPGRTVIPDISIPKKFEYRLRNMGDMEVDESSSTPGPCGKSHRTDDFDARRNRLMKVCPTCRHHPLLQMNNRGGGLEELNIAIDESLFAKRSTSMTTSHTPSTTPANEVFHTTQCLLSKKYRKIAVDNDLDLNHFDAGGTLHCHEKVQESKKGGTSDVSIQSQSSSESPHRCNSSKSLKSTTDSALSPLAMMCSRRNSCVNAFQRAATFNRVIDVQQYRSSGLNFLTDTLFFSTTPFHDRIGSKESIDSQDEPAYSWHIIQLTNPDFIRPVTFRIFIQQVYFFTAYPCEGFLRPGESCYVTLGVKSTEFDPTLVQNHNDESTHSCGTSTNTPQNGFAVQYMFCPPSPCVPDDFWQQEGFLPTSATSQRRNLSAMELDDGVSGRLWTSLHSEAELRTIYLSCHVNERYSFDEFQNMTLSPFEFIPNVNKKSDDEEIPDSLKADSTNTKSPHHPLSLMISGDLKSHQPQLSSFIGSLRIEMDVSNEGLNHRTEKTCLYCNRDWGAQLEYFGAIFMLRKAMCDEIARHRSRQRLPFISDDINNARSNEQIDGLKGKMEYGVTSALAMIFDPQSLSNKGVYEKVQYPGTAVGPRWLLNMHDEEFLNRQRRRQEQRQREMEMRGPQPFLPLPLNGFRLFESIWTICEYFGFCISDEQNHQLLVDRRILIATQWLSNTLMVFPLFCSLVARWALWVSPEPLDHHLEGLPHFPTKKMRYLTSNECGICAILVLLSWLALGRQTERYISRNFERTMMDFCGVALVEKSYRRQTSFYNKASLWLKKQWDYVCPFFLQRMVYMPSWNKRSQHFITRRIVKMKSRDCREDRSVFYANDCLSKADRILDMKDQDQAISEKFTVICLIGAGSFFASSPHYVLNLCTIFFCSISMGLSLSLNYMEISQAPHASTLMSKFSHMRFHVALTLSYLVGQLVGSSGGILFLAEFVVTSVGLLVGGAATISTNAIESWVCFFGLSSTAFWGYLLARVGLSNSIRLKELTSSALLFLSFSIMLVLWTIITFCSWDLPSTVMVLRTQEDCRKTMHDAVIDDKTGGCYALP